MAKKGTELGESAPRYVAAKADDGVPKGYKRTEVGVIPEEWGVARLGSVIKELNSGVSVNSDDVQESVTCDTESILKTSAVANGKFYPEEAKRILIPERKRVKTPVTGNSIIFSRMNTPDLVGECGFVSRDYPYLFLPDRLWITKFHNESTIDVRWLGFLLSSSKYKSKLRESATGTSGSMKNISKNALLNFEMPDLGVLEQRAIAEALSDADALVTALEKLIAKKRAIKAGAMEELLSGKKRLPGFNDIWICRRLDAFGAILGGRQLSPDKIGTFCKYLRVANIFDGYIDFNEVFEMPFTEPEIYRFELHRGDILLNEGQSLDLVGRSAIYLGTPYMCCFQNTLIRFRPNPDNDSDFFQALFSWFLLKGVFASIASQTTSIAHLGVGNLVSLVVRIPPLPEQRAIAAVLSDMDAEIAALESRRDKAAQIKEGMMDALLTGRIRLVDPATKEGKKATSGAKKIVR